MAAAVEAPTSSAGGKAGERRYPAAFEDGTLTQVIVYGRDEGLEEASTTGATLLIAGKCLLSRNGWLMCGTEAVRRNQVGRVVPVYRRTAGQDSGTQHRSITNALRALVCGTTVAASCSDDLAEGSDKPGLGELERTLALIGYRFGAIAFFNALHAPLSVEQGRDAVRWAHKLAGALILLACRASTSQCAAKPLHIDTNYPLLSHAKTLAGGPLSADQRIATLEIANFLQSSESSMLLSGDVGTGKTACFLAAAKACVDAGHSVAVLTPNTLVAESVRSQAVRVFPTEQLAFHTGESVVGNSATAALVIGTHAMFGIRRRFFLLVVDEMHKFSAAQRGKISAEKAIEATATCQPRNVALLTAANVRVARLRERPRGGVVSTHVFDGEEGRGRITAMITEALTAGGQVALVYSRRESVAAKAAEATAFAAFERLRQRFGDRVCLLHGKLSDTEKRTVVDRMNTGAASLLVSTVVIEVGITLPSLRLLVVVDPDRLGLASLHQLRGRVARHGGSGDFVLHHSAPPGEPAHMRAQALVATVDGFEVASRDAELRGIGDLIHGNVQAGKAATIFDGLSVGIADIVAADEAIALNAADATQDFQIDAPRSLATA